MLSFTARQTQAELAHVLRFDPHRTLPHRSLGGGCPGGGCPGQLAHKTGVAQCVEVRHGPLGLPPVVGRDHKAPLRVPARAEPVLDALAQRRVLGQQHLLQHGLESVVYRKSYAGCMLYAACCTAGVLYFGGRERFQSRSSLRPYAIPFAPRAGPCSALAVQCGQYASSTARAKQTTPRYLIQVPHSGLALRLHHSILAAVLFLCLGRRARLNRRRKEAVRTTQRPRRAERDELQHAHVRRARRRVHDRVGP